MAIYHSSFERQIAARPAVARPTLAQAPLYPANVVASWGPTFVVAAHPAEVVPRWGGTLALVRWFGLQVRVLVLTDGVADEEHRRYPAGALRERLEHEELAALDTLGIKQEDVTFLHISGLSIPLKSDIGHDELVALCGSHMAAFAPQTILLPWRRDSDHHAATWYVGRAAAAAIETPLQLLESMMQPTTKDSLVLPHPNEVAPLRIDIAPTARLKTQAYRMQQTAVAEGLIPVVDETGADEWEGFLAPRLRN